MSNSEEGLNQGDTEHESKLPDPVDIIHGLGDRRAELGDVVRIKYQHYRKPGKVEDEGGPLELRLGGKTYGQEFDKGIMGMKVEGTRELQIPPDRGPNRTHNLINILLSRPEYEVYHVTLLAILKSESKANAETH